MRWDLLFADLVAQLDAVDSLAQSHELADLTRAEQSTILLADRLRASAQGRPVTVRLTDGSRLTGQVVAVATDWVLLGEGARRHLVPLVAATLFDGLAPHSVPGPPGAGAGAGRSVPAVLRALMRDRAVVRVRTLAGEVVGRIARVGKDHLDVCDAEGRGAHVVPYSALVCVSEN